MLQNSKLVSIVLLRITTHTACHLLSSTHHSFLVLLQPLLFVNRRKLFVRHCPDFLQPFWQIVKRVNHFEPEHGSLEGFVLALIMQNLFVDCILWLVYFVHQLISIKLCIVNFFQLGFKHFYLPVNLWQIVSQHVIVLFQLI